MGAFSLALLSSVQVQWEPPKARAMQSLEWGRRGDEPSVGVIFLAEDGLLTPVHLQ